MTNESMKKIWLLQKEPGQTESEGLLHAEENEQCNFGIFQI